ncbi:MAG: helix-turn-helix transcriptional regulator [Gemmatimonadaceae bacterium]|nr:helix-turn-helix transcriptional regulator [Gemmatimonadaceae bacterium]
MPKATIRNDIRRLRFAHDEMTQQALADRVGCTRQTIMMLEQGRYVPSLLLALQIAKVFGTTVEAIFTLDDARDDQMPGVQRNA